MTDKKESVEINCTGCGSAFRLWIPVESIGEWEEGVRINCIRCGAEYFVKKSDGAFEVSEAATAASSEASPAREAAPSPPPAEPRTAPAPGPGASHAPAVTADNVIFVEDDRLAREMARNSLKDIGVNLFLAKNSTEAVEIIESQPIKLIVTDLYLKNPSDPESKADGEEFLKQLVDSGRHIPAIVTTGKDIVDDLILDPKWFDLHVKGFIQKGNPFWVEDLKLKVKELLFKD